jgi:replication factor A1
MVQLTAGSCQALQNAAPGETALFDATHTLQLLSVRLVNSNGASTVDRYRIIVSDGLFFIQAMLATQLNHLVQDREIDKNTIVNITKMTCNFVQDKRCAVPNSRDAS